MAKQSKRTVFSRLGKLFKSGPVVKRKLKNWRPPSVTSAKDVFAKSLSNAYAQAINSYGQYDRLARYNDYCFAPNTLVYTTAGTFTIKELTEKYAPGERFFVYAYDYEDDQIKIAPAHSPRVAKGGVLQACVDVILDDGTTITVTADHKFVLRDGTTCDAGELIAGQSLMPFYKRDLMNSGYQWIYKGKKRNGWQTEHRMVAEYFHGPLKDNEVVHHNDFVASNNHITNLRVMTDADHRHLHAQLNNTQKFGKSNKAHSKWMKKYNPQRRKDITFKKILDTAIECDFVMSHVKTILNVDANAIKRRLREHGIANWITLKENRVDIQKFVTHLNIEHETRSPEFDEIMISAHEARTLDELAFKLCCTRNAIYRRITAHGYKNWSHLKEFLGQGKAYAGKKKGPECDPSLTYQMICSAYKNGMTRHDLADSVGSTINKVMTRLQNEGFNSYVRWTNAFENHKVVSVSHSSQQHIVYNVTVEHYHNLAVGGINNKNAQAFVIATQSEMEYTPEIASALNIYADEATSQDDKGTVLHVYSENPKIKQLLDELFYDTLNINFELNLWVRHLVKYGDFFAFLDVAPDHGVIAAFPIPVNQIEREEGYDPSDPLAFRFRWTTMGNKALEAWQVAHFRLTGNEAFLPYGSSVLESSRRIWRQLILAEDAMLVYRVVRSPERRVFYIDVANVPTDEIPSYLEAARDRLRSNIVIDNQTGRTDLRYNPLPIDMTTPIPLLDGRVIPISELADEFAQGKENWVYSVQDNSLQIVPGKVSWCGKNYTAERMIKVLLDDDSWAYTAPEHPFMLRDGSSKRADMLQHGDRLMPFYTKQSTLEDGWNVQGYPTIYNPRSGKYELVHRLVANNALCKQREQVRAEVDWLVNNNLVVHHKNFDSNNASPNNLQWMGNVDHWKHHAMLGHDNFVNYNRSTEKRIATRKNNVERNSVAAMAWYNGSELHKQHNENRSRGQKKAWADAAKSSIRKRAMRVEFDDCVWSALRDGVGLGIIETQNDAIQYVNENLIDHLLTFNTSTKLRNNRKITKPLFKGRLNDAGFNDFAAFKSSYKNHCVVQIEEVNEQRDVYCMTVVGPHGEDDRHNFAILTFRNDNAQLKDGVIVLNSVDEDYFIPTRGSESGTRIETLPGGTNVTAIEDVQYLQGKLFAALQVPKAYLGYDEALSSKATLAQEDIRFSRTINKIQRTLLSELNKIASIHLYVNGFTDEGLLDFELQLSNPSTIAQQQRLEIHRTMFDIAGIAPEGVVSIPWIQKNIFKFSDVQIRQIREQQQADIEWQKKLEDIGAAAEVGGASGGGGGGGGSGPAGGGGGGGDDIFADFDEMINDEGEEGGESEGGDEEKESDEPPEEAFSPDGELIDELDVVDDAPTTNELSPPIKPSARSKMLRHNRRRRVTVNTGDKQGLTRAHMPDFNDMVGDQESLDDPYDDSFFRNLGKLTETDVLEHAMGSYAVDQAHMTSSLRKLLGKINNDLRPVPAVLLEVTDDLVEDDLIEDDTDE